jgi:hypothetical protein
LKFDIELHVRIEDVGILRFNQFRCRRDKLTKFVSDWKYQVWREHGCRDMVVEQILVNHDEDIKDEVKEHEGIVGRGHLPF